MANAIKTPRPHWVDDKATKKEKCEVLLMGTSESGLVVKVFVDHMEINGYYESEHEVGKMLANIRKPISITWDELEKAKKRAMTSPKRIKAIEPDYEDEPSKEYLATLPQVHLNGVLFYIDGERKERRLVANPKKVYVYFKKEQEK